MSHNQTYITESVNSFFEQVVPADQYLESSIATARSPFVRKSAFRRVYKFIRIACVRALQRVTGERLYCVDEMLYVRALSPETRALLIWLTQNNYLDSWRCGALTPGFPPTNILRLEPKAFKSPQGTVYQQVGANGIGQGETLEEAALPALGEFVERLASYSDWWLRTDTKCSLYNKHATPPMIDFNTFSFYTPTQVRESEKIPARSVVHADQKVTWVQAKRLDTNTLTQIPLSLIYSYFNKENLNEPAFIEVNSSGAGAHSTYEDAVYGSVLELVERHVFLRSWYHKNPGRRIDLNSLFVHFQKQKIAYEQLCNKSVQTDIFDITDNLGIPTLLMIQTNPHQGQYAVNVSAVTDFRFEIAVKKLLSEMVRFAHHTAPNNPGKDNINVPTANEPTPHPTGFMERYRLWSKSDMIPHVRWYRDTAPEVTYVQLQKEYGLSESTETPKERYRMLQQYVSDRGIPIYVVETTNDLARHAGLRVVKSVSSELIPIFFDERNQPLGLHTFTHNSRGASVALNPIPHPFI